MRRDDQPENGAPADMYANVAFACRLWAGASELYKLTTRQLMPGLNT